MLTNFARQDPLVKSGNMVGMPAAVALLFFLTAIVSEYVTICWHRARETGHVGPAIGLGMILESIAWAPLILAIDAGAEVWPIALADILGGAVGIWFGMRRIRSTSNASQ